MSSTQQPEPGNPTQEAAVDPDTEQVDNKASDEQMRPPEPAATHRGVHPLRPIALSAVLAAAVGAAVLAAGTHVNQAPTPDPTPTGLHAGAVQTGNPTSPTTVDVYAEYGCPNCGPALEQAAGALEYARTNGTANVRLHLSATTGTQAATVANAVACAADDDSEHAADYYMSLMPYPTAQVTDAFALETGDRLNIATTTFKDCVTHGSYKPWLSAHGDLAAYPAADLPIFEVNGTVVDVDTLTSTIASTD